ncbi:MAG: EAL domain-containing protein, partial [Lachnospiraceae bacterium]|nr:EAL domain-containing protein [Lachnospiraceae bacterium]
MKLYHFDEKTREAYEKQGIPFAFYQFTNDRLVLLLASDGLCKVFGMTREEYLDAEKHNTLINNHPDDIDGMTSAFLDFAISDDNETLNMIYRARRYGETEYRLIHAQGAHVYMEDGTRLEQIWYTDESQFCKKLPNTPDDMVEYLKGKVYIARSYYDHLTGLPNMNYFISLAKSFFEELGKGKKKGAVCALNICGLRGFNAKYGIDEGNILITIVADILRKNFTNENCSRFGEDHFFFYSELEGLEEKILKIFEELKNANYGKTAFVRVGIYVVNDNKLNIDAYCDNARIASDWNKNVYASRYTYFDSVMAEYVKNKEYIIENLNRVIRDRYIKIYYQPQIRLLNGKVYGAEALSRWEDPKFGSLPPSVFVPILEDSNLTYKLDIYVIREVVEQLKTLIQSGVQPMPISVNISRTDFLYMDPAKLLTKITDENHIPHNLIRVEITESTVMQDPKGIGQHIKRLHENGFEVLMDDFGSGYSSLNTLRDFDFDEIKIDMGFIKRFDDRGKEIIRSMVMMAKRLGIHTLMEGAETQEQIDFLRDLGCELVQGYYFGSPMPFVESNANLKRKGILMEEAEEKEFFDKVGLVNVITDKPIALFFYNGESFELYYANDEYMRNRYDDWNAMAEDRTNSSESLKKELIYHLKKVADNAIRSKKKEVLTFVVENKYYRIECTDIAGYSKGHMQKLSYYDITSDEATKESKIIDEVLRNIMSVYESIYALDYKKDEVEVVITNNVIEHAGDKIDSINSVLHNPAMLEGVYPPDRRHFTEVMEKEYLRERISKTERNCFTEIFRIKITAETYKWVEYMFISIKSFGEDKILLCLRCLEDKKSSNVMAEVKNILNQYSVITDGEKEEVSTDLSEVAWKNLEENTDIMFFWKDRNRRFLGASRAFLDYYGFKSADMILGKTDEEMGWHPDEQQYKDVEEDVIKRGLVMSAVPGQIFVKGSIRNIQATKFPLMKDGEVVGLIGYFEDQENRVVSSANTDLELYADAEKGVMNMRGLYLALQSYDDNLRLNDIKYGLLTIEIPEFSEIYVAFGKTTADKLISKIIDTIRNTFHNSGTIAQIKNCTFAVVEKGITREQMEDYARACADFITNIREVGGRIVNLSTIYGIEMCDVHNSVQLMVSNCIENMRASRIDLDGLDEYISSAVLQIPDVYKDVP